MKIHAPKHPVAHVTNDSALLVTSRFGFRDVMLCCVLAVLIVVAWTTPAAQQRPGEPAAPIVVERQPTQDYTPAPDDPLVIGPISETVCGPNDFVVRHGGLTFCLYPGVQGSLNLGGDEVECRLYLPPGKGKRKL